MSAHTPEPWHIKARQDGGFDVFGPQDSAGDATRRRFIGKILDWGAGVGEAEANARRVVACIGALAGIPTEAIEQGAVRAALRKIGMIP